MADENLTGIAWFDSLSDAGKAGLLGVVLVLLGAIYYFALHMSLSNELSQEEERNKTMKLELTKAEQRQQEYLRIKKTLTERQALDRYHLRILPEKAEIGSFLQDLNRLAELSGLDIKLVEPKTEEPGQNYIKIPVALHLHGRYHHVLKFFYNTSLVERAISMENIKLTNPQTVGDEIRLAVEVQATTFRRADAAPGSGAPKSGSPIAVAPPGGKP